MPHINLLSPSDAQKIAAGEVVERPINIVKELVENALDARATRLTIHIKDGGKELIRIIDNGCGMDETDARVCFERYATSKLQKFSDLPSITTFGFRGEALASIASISKVTLITKPATAQLGTKVTLEAGTVLRAEQTAANTGTDIQVTDLFYNVPVRKKFLKQRETELRHIMQFLHGICLSQLQLGLTVINDGITILHCLPTDSLANRCTQLWPVKNPLTINHERNRPGIICQGAISPTTYTRYDRAGIFIIVNQRIISDYKLSNAIIKGYSNTLPSGKYPYAVILITVDPETVDINIHPRKDEVLFAHPGMVETVVQEAIKKALAQETTDIIETTSTINSHHIGSSPIAKHNSAPNNTLSPISGPIHTPQPHNILPSIVPAQKPLATTTSFKSSPPATYPTYTKPVSATDLKAPTTESIRVDQTTAFQETVHIVGYYKKTYILIEHADGLLFIDIHAAHERILYEKFTTEFASVQPVQLLFPTTIALSANDIAILIPYLPIFIENKIIIEQLSVTELVVTAVPHHLQTLNITELINEVLSWIHKETGDADTMLFKRINEKLHAQMACKAAIKAGDDITQQRMYELISELYRTPNHHCCPHGRPTTFIFGIDEIEKKFKRIK